VKEHLQLHLPKCQRLYLETPPEMQVMLYLKRALPIRTKENSEEAEAIISIGGTTTVGVGLAIESTNKLSIKAAGGLNQSWENNTTQQSCITTTKVISTSPGDAVVGSKAGGDVYVGIAEMTTYGSASILNMDFDTGELKVSTKSTINDVRL
jgi:hypothetical protein